MSDPQKVVVLVKGTEAFTFKPGKAVILPDFKKYLWGEENEKNGPFYKMAKKIIKRRDLGDLTDNIDVLEIIGHTDGQPLAKSQKVSGNLDAKLPDFLAGKNPDIAELKAGGNNDLGLLRALAIKPKLCIGIAD